MDKTDNGSQRKTLVSARDRFTLHVFFLLDKTKKDQKADFSNLKKKQQPMFLGLYPFKCLYK